jgi:hypothetical protein
VGSKNWGGRKRNKVRNHNERGVKTGGVQDRMEGGSKDGIGMWKLERKEGLK